MPKPCCARTRAGTLPLCATAWTVIDEEADRLAEMIDNLLDASRLQAGSPCA